VFEGDGVVNEYVGGYDDWVAQKKLTEETELKAKKQTETKKPNHPKKKLSYKNQREYDGLEKKLEDIEAEIEKLQNDMTQPDFYQKSPQDITKIQDLFTQRQEDLDAAYQRWEELEALI
jgi:ATP-binding cassette subfamily F protein uup